MDSKTFLANFEKIDDNYYDFTPLENVEFGASYKRKDKTQNNYVSLFFIYASKVTNAEDTRIPLQIRATYGVNTKDGISTISNSEIGLFKVNSFPIPFESKDDYFYDLKSNQFYKGNKCITAQELLQELYQIHTKPTKLFSGLFLRIKLYTWRVLMTAFYKKIFFLLSTVFFYVSKQKVTGDIWTTYFGSSIPTPSTGENNVKISEQQKTNIFGIEAPKRSIILFCILHFIVFLIFWLLNIKPLIVKAILNNNFILIIYIVSFIEITEFIISPVIPFFIRKIAMLHASAALKEITI